MKVAHIFNELKFSGAEVMYVSAARNFQQLGCELYAIETSSKVGEYKREFELNGYTYVKIKTSGRWSILSRLRFFCKLYQFITDEKIDVIHIHRSDVFVIVSLLGWLLKKRVVYTFHNVFRSKPYSKWFHACKRMLAKKVFKCTFQTISDSVYNNELEYYGNKTLKVYNWYNDEKYSPGIYDEKVILRKELNIADDDFVLVSIGGCSDIKRHSHIIQAMNLIKNDVPNLLYLHLGNGKSEQSERALVQELGLIKSVRFLGNQTDVRKYLVASDLYLMPSMFEGISITTIEAMACEVPCLLYDVPGLRDFNNLMQTSIIIKPSFDLLAKGIVDVFEGKYDLAKLTGNGQLFVRQFFSKVNNSRQIFQLYRGS